jgi:AcrR family transcriptional regulator
MTATGVRRDGAPPGSGAARPARGRRTGRRPGGADTRGRILAAARAEFAGRGFEGATIRAIAAAAGVDPALVHHYFGSKQRLFIAAMELPVDFDAAVAGTLAGPPELLGERLVRMVLSLWEGPSARSLMLGLVRSAASDEIAAGMLRGVLAQGPFLALARTIDLPDAPVRAALVGTQIVGLAMARYVVRVEPIASMDADPLARMVGPTIQRYLTGDLPGT